MDLNLIRTFVAVYEARGLTMAAERLYVTQPAVSHALRRLRREFDDPLFVKQGRFMRPTEIAHGVYPELRKALLGIENVVDTLQGFDMSASVRRFRLALSELGEIAYLPAIATAVNAAAPNVSLEVVPLDVHDVADWLSSGAVDLAITSAPISGAFEYAVLKTTRYVALSSDVARTRNPLTLGDYCAAEHVIVSGDSGYPVVEAALRSLRVEISPRYSVTRFAALPRLLARTPLLATIPDEIAQEWAASRSFGLRELPFPVKRVDVCMYKRASTHNRAALEWLFEQSQEALRDTPGVTLFA